MLTGGQRRKAATATAIGSRFRRGELKCVFARSYKIKALGVAEPTGAGSNELKQAAYATEVRAS